MSTSIEANAGLDQRARHSAAATLTVRCGTKLTAFAKHDENVMRAKANSDVGTSHFVVAFLWSAPERGSQRDPTRYADPPADRPRRRNRNTGATTPLLSAGLS